MHWQSLLYGEIIDRMANINPFESIAELIFMLLLGIHWNWNKSWEIFYEWKRFFMKTWYNKSDVAVLIFEQLSNQKHINSLLDSFSGSIFLLISYSHHHITTFQFLTELTAQQHLVTSLCPNKLSCVIRSSLHVSVHKYSRNCILKTDFLKKSMSSVNL